MEILKQHHSKRDGNDCIIYRNVALIKSNDEYLIIVHERYTGWSPATDYKIVDFSFYETALECYENCIK